MDIYGPEGTRDLIRAMIQLTYSRIASPYRVHELKSVPLLWSDYKAPLSDSSYVLKGFDVPLVRTRFDPTFGEVEGSTDIYPDSSGHYSLFDEDGTWADFELSTQSFSLSSLS